MKTTRKRLSMMAVVAALGFGMTGATAADVEGKAKLGEAEAATRIQIGDEGRDAGTPGVGVATGADTATRAHDAQPAAQGVRDIHKASKVIGMEVKNQTGETLGNIEDLVVDLNTGQISYAVLGVGGFLGIGEKYIAVPPKAFKMGIEEDQLVLNADKAKIQAAPGFVKTNWPDYRDPQFSTFWEAETEAGLGGATGVETQRGTTEPKRDALENDRLNRNLQPNDQTTPERR